MAEGVGGAGGSGGINVVGPAETAPGSGCIEEGAGLLGGVEVSTASTAVPATHASSWLSRSNTATWSERTKRWTTAVYCVSLLALGVVIGGVGPTLPGLARLTNATLAEQKWLFVSRAGGYVIGSVAGGPFVDKLAGGPLMSASCLLLGVGISLSALSGSLVALLFTFALTGSAGGVLDCGTNTLLVWIWGSKVSQPMQLMHFCFGVGSFLSPVVTSLVLDLAGEDIRPALYFQAIMCIPPSMLFLCTRSPIEPTVERERGEFEDDAAGKAAEEAADAALRRRLVLVALFVSAFLCLAVGSEVSYGGWLSTYAIRRFDATESSAALLTSVYWGSFTVGRLIGVAASARVSPRRMLLIDLGIGVGSALVLVVTDDMAATWVGAAGLGLAISTMFPSSVSLPPSLGLPVSGKLTSWFVVGSSVGEMVVPLGMGAAIDEFGPASMNVTMLGIMLAAVALLSTLTLATGKRHEETFGDDRGAGIGDRVAEHGGGGKLAVDVASAEGGGGVQMVTL